MFIAPCLALLALVPFQESTPKKADPFEATLKGVGYAYKTDDDGDYNIEIAWKEEKRSQMIFVRGVSEKITEPKQADVGSREIWSLCWKGKTKPSADVLEKLAITHYKIGAFQLEKTGESGWSAYYRVDVPDNASTDFVRQAIRITSEAADNMEKELLGTDDL